MFYHELLKLNYMLGLIEHLIEAVGVLVQIFIAILLFCYTRETYKLRKTAEEQIETMLRPCVVPLVKERSDSSVRMDIDKGCQSPELRVLDPGRGESIRLHNIGNGPAVNIEIEASFVDLDIKDLKESLPYIAKDGKEATYLGASISNSGRGAVRIKLSYQSLSGQSYKSTMRIKDWDAVVTDLEFQS